MDPPALINSNGTLQSSNASPYNLAEIWQFPINGGVSVGESGSGLDLRSVQFAPSLGQFPDNAGANTVVSGDGPMVLDRRTAPNGGARKRRDAAMEDESAKVVLSRIANGMNNCDGKRLKTSGSTDNNGDAKVGGETNSSQQPEQNSKQPDPPKQDYIHVRARRGQATDSHSLAERARREKISERMKILQDLVPGCNKVTGKALVLDEIINYIQSLQRQVEFLSMKLEALNSSMNTCVEGFPTKDFDQQTFETAGVTYGSQATREHGRSTSPEWLHMQIGGGFERTS